ncbi:MAG: hypothetical protein U5O69_07745 [Candidatus Competibacteraceae bacterium]|nr:hypothetical protein [Candidatus Competibacteraceae bacterium]
MPATSWKVSATSRLEVESLAATDSADFKVPGWMLSTGTLRLLALLALLRHPQARRP